MGELFLDIFRKRFLHRKGKFKNLKFYSVVLLTVLTVFIRIFSPIDVLNVLGIPLKTIRENYLY